MRIVIKLGGHLISTNAAIIDLGYIEKLTSVLRKVKEKIISGKPISLEDEKILRDIVKKIVGD